MTAVELRFTIEKVNGMGDGTMEVVATGTAPEDAVQPQGGDQPGFTVMGNVPPGMRGMLENMGDMFRNQQKPMIKFRLTREEYERGDWKVGNLLRVKVVEEAE